MSRQVFHETLHLWQYVGSGYLAKLAEEDWVRLKRFLGSGEVTSSGPRRSHLLSSHKDHRFSPLDLVEGIARFWDVQVISPPLLMELEISAGTHNFSNVFLDRYRELEENGLLYHPVHGGYTSASFDLAMEGPGGGWAEPYRRVRAQLPDLLAATFFPAAGFLALQTEDPVGAFMFLLSGADSLRAVDFPKGVDIALMWRWVAPLLQDAVKEFDTERLGPGLHIAQNGPLSEHPVWRWLLACGQVGVQLGGGEFLHALAFPGDYEVRGWLLDLMLPPLVLFADGTTWHPAEWYGQYSAAPTELAESFDLLIEDMRTLADRWSALLRDLRGY